VSQPSQGSRSEALLFERECRGLRLLMQVRIAVVIGSTLVHWLIGYSLFEKLAATALGALSLAVLAGCLVLLARRRAVALAGLVGCAVDLAVLAALPAIWYQSVGGDAVPPAYLLKTQITTMTLSVVVLNGLAIRPLYPLVVAAGAVVIHGVLLAYALADPRTELTADFVYAVMGPGLSQAFVLTSMMTVALTGLAVAYVTLVARRTVTQAVRLEVTNSQLGRYFSPGVVARIAADADALTASGGRTQAVAVLFCDIRGFTPLTEAMASADVVALLSRFQGAVVEAVFAHGGTVDKFIGDAVMATFGTPDPAPDDAERAVRAGLAMTAALAELNGERERAGQRPIRHGVSIHYGPVIAGNIGPPERLEYTVIGDTVNVASRMQDACKTLNQPLLISAAVRERLPDGFTVRELAAQSLRGRRAAVQLYAVDGATA